MLWDVDHDHLRVSIINIGLHEHHQQQQQNNRNNHSLILIHNTKKGKWLTSTLSGHKFFVHSTFDLFFSCMRAHSLCILITVRLYFNIDTWIHFSLVAHNSMRPNHDLVFIFIFSAKVFWCRCESFTFKLDCLCLIGDSFVEIIRMWSFYSFYSYFYDE